MNNIKKNKRKRKKLRSRIAKKLWESGVFKNQSKKIADGIASGKIKVNGGRRGKFKKWDGTEISYDSLYELARCLYLNSKKRVWDKPNVVINYNEDGFVRRYVPDFIIYYKNKIMLEEIKPADFIGSEMKLKEKAAEKFCKKRGWKFRIITENTLFKEIKYNGLKRNTKKEVDRFNSKKTS